jgi:hypothetical protein
MNARFFVLPCVVSVLAGCAGTEALRVEDQLVPVGRQTSLHGRIMSRRMDGSVSGVGARSVTFFVNDLDVVDGESDASGYARVVHSFKHPGEHSLRAQHVGAFGRPAADEGRVFVWRPEDVILVIDLDGAMADTEPTRVWIDAVKAAEPYSQSAEVLRWLAGDFKIIYLTSRPRELLKKTAKWLETYRFPLGPVLSMEVAYSESPESDGFEERLDVIRKQFPQTVIGIANRMGYYDSFQRNGLFTILVEHGQAGVAARIEGGVVVRDWLQVRELITRNPGLKDPAVARTLASNAAGIALPQ